LAETSPLREMSNTMDTKTKRKPPTPEEIITEQKRIAEAAKPRANAVVPRKPANTVPATPDSRTMEQRYVDSIAPANIVGRMIKFSKDGNFVTSDDDEAVDENVEFIALCDETLIGWIKFNGDDAPPDRVHGLLYDGFMMPARHALGDTDKTRWQPGLGGMPEDPWKHQICLPLQNVETHELFTFVTTSQTGRRAIGNLLRHFDRMQRKDATEVPVVKLKPGGFNHRDSRVGWVATPQFCIVGRVPRDSAAKPNTSVAADMNDSIPL
jgi:hypothetical protein